MNAPLESHCEKLTVKQRLERYAAGTMPSEEAVAAYRDTLWQRVKANTIGKRAIRRRLRG